MFDFLFKNLPRYSYYKNDINFIQALFTITKESKNSKNKQYKFETRLGIKKVGRDYDGDLCGTATMQEYFELFNQKFGKLNLYKVSDELLVNFNNVANVEIQKTKKQRPLIMFYFSDNTALGFEIENNKESLYVAQTIVSDFNKFKLNKSNKDKEM